MRIIARKTLREFWASHPTAMPSLEAWLRDAERSTWTGPADIKARYARASFVGADRVVFNIGGNNYRLVIEFKYRVGIGYVRFIGTHAEYDRIHVATV